MSSEKGTVADKAPRAAARGLGQKIGRSAVRSGEWPGISGQSWAADHLSLPAVTTAASGGSWPVPLAGAGVTGLQVVLLVRSSHPITSTAVSGAVSSEGKTSEPATDRAW